MKRDAKGLYRDALAGRKKNVVGVDIPFVPPEKPDLVVNNDDGADIDEIVRRIVDCLPNMGPGYERLE